MDVVYLLFYDCQEEPREIESANCEAFSSPFERFRRIEQLKGRVLGYYLRDLNLTTNEDIDKDYDPWAVHYDDTRLNDQAEECIDEFDGEPPIFSPYEPD